MSNIEAGEYIRTDNGYIGKYLTYEDNDEDITAGLIMYENKWINPCIEVNIVKHSFSLIELLEEYKSTGYYELERVLEELLEE